MLVLLALSCQERSGSPPTAQHAEIVEAAALGPVDGVVRDAMLRARRSGRRLIVYVSAEWCEPCKYFQSAVAAGEIDGGLANLRLLKFDFDRDETRLRAAGYDLRMIPLFALPEPSGRSGPSIRGSIKGPGAVDQIRPRLQALLIDNPSD